MNKSLNNLNMVEADRSRQTKQKVIETVIGGTTEKKTIEQAIDAWSGTLSAFLLPDAIAHEPELSSILSIASSVRERIKATSPLATSIIHEINDRVKLLISPKYQDVASRDRRLWSDDPNITLPVGVRACVDAGVPREGVIGIDGNMGRTLAGDDELIYVPAKKKFATVHSLLGKRLIHTGRMGDDKILEVFVEHTGCGRRGQMIANLANNGESSRLIQVVFNNLVGLNTEFEYGDDAVTKIDDMWKKKQEGGFPFMIQDSGRWIGIILKIAQRQAYNGLPDVNLAIPIQLYDKHTGNLITGLDTIEALTHPAVAEAGGFTDKVIEQLVDEKIVFSMRKEFSLLEETGIDLETEWETQKGSMSFEQVQSDWFNALHDRVDIVESLWSMFKDKNPKYDSVRSMVERFLKTSTIQIQKTLSKIDNMPNNGIDSKVIMNRLIHQLFHSFAYVWQQNSFEVGHVPGKHVEDHLATGESGEIGIKQHLALGQGDLNPADAHEIFTGRSVILHSIPGQKGDPIVIFLKNDTERKDNEPMTNEETDNSMHNFEELLKLWPYVLVGDIVPYIVIRGKQNNGAISRIGLSVLKSFGDILNAHSQTGILPEFVPATNSHGQVVLVPANELLNRGIKADDLTKFREQERLLADELSDSAIQKRLRD